MATIVYPNGSFVDLRPDPDTGALTLEQLQQAVGGYIEAVYCPDGRVMMVNEQGKLKNLALNHYATKVSDIWNQARDVIVGPIVIGTPQEMGCDGE